MLTNKKWRLKSSVIVILAVVVAGAIGVLFLIFMNCDSFGVPKDKIEDNARIFHGIDNNWEVRQGATDQVSAMIFFPENLQENVYSIYVKHKAGSKRYFFRIGGTISEISDECACFNFLENQSCVYLSMNKQKICRAEIDDGDAINEVLLQEDQPFVLAYPTNAGNIFLYDTNGNVVIPIQRDIP